MAFAASTISEIQTGGNDANGGSFDPGNANFAADGAATSATGSSPVFSSASYTFVAGDVGAWVYIKSGTNWTPGWYQIASVAGGVATLTASVGAAVIFRGGAYSLADDLIPSTVAGCATTASPTGATFGVDYSQQALPQFTFTDMVIDGTTNTKFTSVANPVGKNFVGNSINVTSGTGFTVQRVQVVSTSGTTATCDKSLGTLSSTGGNGKLGGAYLTWGTPLSSSTLVIAGNRVFSKSGTYTITSAIALGSSGDDTSGAIRFQGYQTVRGDNTGTRPVLTSSTNSVNLVSLNAKTRWRFNNFKLTHTAATRGAGFIALAGTPSYISFSNFVIDGCLNGFQCANIGAENPINQSIAENGEILNCTNDAVQFGGQEVLVSACYIHNNARDGVRVGGGLAGGVKCDRSQICLNGGKGINLATDGTLAQLSVSSSTIARNAGDGIGSSISSANPLALRLSNNIFDLNGGWEVNLANSAVQILANHHNAYRNSASGTRNNLPVGSGDVTLTADPFTNAASGDFSLNTTAGGGAACRAAGFPGAFPGGLTTGYLAIGAVQPKDSPPVINSPPAQFITEEIWY
jgi:hypothetical protein